MLVFQTTPQSAYFGTQSEPPRAFLKGKPLNLTLKFGISLQKPELKCYFLVV